MATPQEMLGMPPGMPGVQPIGLPDPAGLPEIPMELPAEEPEIRGEVIDWAGGKPINLKKKLKSGKTVKEELSKHVKEILESELKNNDGVYKKIKSDHALYKAEKQASRPKPWMANVSIPAARIISDSIFVRVHDMVWNKRRVYMMSPRGAGDQKLNDRISIWEKAFDNYVRNDLDLKEKMRFPTRQCVNSGTGEVKIVYETKNKTIYRYSSDEDKYNDTVKKYRLPGTKNTVVKEPSVVFRGPNVYPIDRAKFVISSDAMSIDEAYIVGFSFDKRKNQLKTLATRGIYDKDSVDKLTASRVDDVAETRATSAGMALDKLQYTEPYTLWELWLRYDVDDDGEEDDIVITFHRESGQILKAIYNPIFYGYRPFCDMKGASQVAYTYDGEGICEMIQGMSEELDTLHNLLLDRLKLINLPIIFARAGIGLDNYELEPGKIKVIDDNPQEAIFVVKQPDVTFSLVNEINWLIDKMFLVCGITPISLGISTAERPVAKESMMVQEETNKKFKSWTDRARECYREIGFKLLEAFAQYQPTYEYTDENGELMSVEMPTGNIREYLNLDLMVSSEEWNMTMRREVELMKYQLLSDYMTKNAGMAQLMVSPQVPSDMKKYLAQADKTGSRALAKVLDNFENTEKESEIVSMAGSMDIEKCIAQSIDLIQQQAAMAGQMGGPPTGQPGAEQGALPPATAPPGTM